LLGFLILSASGGQFQGLRPAAGLRPRTRARGAFGALELPSRRGFGEVALAREREGRKGIMLNIYPVILQFVSDVGLLVPRVAHHDPDLARQLRRSAASVALNTSEATYALGRTRTAAYNTALREMRESYTALEVSVRLGYLAPLDAALEDRISRILKTLYRLSFPRAPAA